MRAFSVLQGMRVEVTSKSTLSVSNRSPTHTLRLSRPSSNEISDYGTQALDPLIRALIGHVAFQHFEFGPTHYRDMLHICAQGEQDV